jgi:hypothetical protein
VSGSPIVGGFANTSTDSNPNYFGGAPFTSFVSGGVEYALTYTATSSSFTGGGNDIALMAIPEPCPPVTFLCGSGILFALGRFRRRKSL